jgi:GDP-4-dehydro-6-deoxy-D-mannose reductase
MPVEGASRNANPPRERVVLVTGHSGFVGQVVFNRESGFLQQRGWRPVALPEGLDIRDASLGTSVASIAPDAILHLAALSNVAESFKDPDACFDVNFRGTQNLLRAARAAGFHGRFLYVSSGDCYGPLDEASLPAAENLPLRPSNPYAVSKVAAEALCYQWTRSEGLDGVIARSFNHTGPGQTTQFFVPAICRQVALIARKRAPARLMTGNLDVTRDFADVRDVVHAYAHLLEHGRTGEAYNVASGREVRLRDVVDEVLALAGVTAEVVTDPSRVRAHEQRRVVASIAKIRTDTAWEPSIPLSETLRETVDYWMRRVADE